MEELDLLKVLQEYLFFNALPLSHVASMTKIPYHTLYAWTKGRRNLNAKNIIKVRDYLNGRYEIGAESVANHLLRGEEHATGTNT